MSGRLCNTLGWRAGVTESLSFCVFPFKFLLGARSLTEKYQMYWDCCPVTVTVSLVFNLLKLLEKLFDQFMVKQHFEGCLFFFFFFLFSQSEKVIKKICRDPESSQLLLWVMRYIFSLANYDFHMKLMVPGNWIPRRPWWGRMKGWGRPGWPWRSIMLKCVVLRTEEGQQKRVLKLPDNEGISNKPFHWLPKVGHIKFFVLCIMMSDAIKDKSVWESYCSTN